MISALAAAALDGTELYRRVISYDYGDEERSGLMREVWAATPWMADAFTGSCDSDRCHEVREWLYETFGPQAFPFGPSPKPGRWQLGGVTIFGWNWIGFAVEADLTVFRDRWGDVPPEAVRAAGRLG